MNRVAALVFAVASSVTSTAHAEDPLPWEVGITPEQREKAQALFSEANELFAKQAHGPALDKYQAAIAIWDHPLIRFNMAVAQIRLDRVLDAVENLEHALRYGAAPFGEEAHLKALDYRQLVDGRVGYIEATCDQPGTQVLLDGKPWIACPGNAKLRVLAGEHALVAEKPEFLTFSRRVVVAGKTTSTTKVELVPLDEVVRYEYRWPRWLPWTTAGLGAAVALGGLGVWVSGNNEMQQFEADLATACAKSCNEDLSDVPVLARNRDSAERKGTIGIAMIAAGGGVVLGGVVWALVNRPRRVLPQLEVAPSADGVRAAASWRF